MNIGIIGGGAVAQFLLKQDLAVKSLLVTDQEKYKFLEEKYGVDLFTELDDFLASNIKMVVEAANIAAVKTYLPKIIKKMDLVVISIGAFSDEEFLRDTYQRLENSNYKIHLPSGAIGGLDLLQNASSLGELEEVMIRTRKPAHTLTEEEVKSERLLFSGSAKEAIKKFPANVNVSIVLSLAGLGTKKTKVEIIADPDIEKNIHTIFLKGDFGSARLEVVNNPMKTNPKTSLLAALSVLGTIDRLNRQIQIG